jgi:hypothetical protein
LPIVFPLPGQFINTVSALFVVFGVLGRLAVRAGPIECQTVFSTHGVSAVFQGVKPGIFAVNFADIKYSVKMFALKPTHKNLQMFLATKVNPDRAGD